MYFIFRKISMKQIIYIGGWDRFPDIDSLCKAFEKRTYDPFKENKKRSDWLKEQLILNYQMIKPDMPNRDMASYRAWKIWFEKIFPYLNDEDLVLVGHSLWWNFLMKYLWENIFPKKIKQLHLVAAVVDGSDRPADKQYLWDFAFDVNNIKKLENIAEEIFIYHSTDDPTVPYSHAEKIKSYLPKAKLITFTDRGHIRQPEFSELLENILHG